MAKHQLWFVAGVAVGYLIVPQILTRLGKD